MESLGLNSKIKEQMDENIDLSEVARVVAEHKERYKIQTKEGIFNAEITGNLRFSAESRNDLPAVGDWVRIQKMDEQNAIIFQLYPRFSILERQAVGKSGETQIIAANIDHAFIVMAVGHDYNLNRLERYLIICRAGKINPIIVLSKTDLVSVDQKTALLDEIKNRVHDVKVITISNENLEGYTEFKKVFRPYETYCFVGSSGVGKSTIINHLKSDNAQKTSKISESTGKGKHTTTHRELIILPNKSIVIDTPGMRELGIADQSSGLEQTFDTILELAKDCRYGDCTHENETGCAVLEALANDSLSPEVYNNYIKLRKEQEHFESTVHEKRRKGREFGKMVKEVTRFKKDNKY